jgi:RNA polymerase sigma-70 factor (ECF subfamily)
VVNPASLPSAARSSLRVVSGGEAGTVSFSDEQLIEAFESGDTRVARHLYDRLIGVVDSTLCRLLRERGPDHDDLVQTAFEQIMITLSKKRFARACSLASWAGAVTTNVALNALRSRIRERRVIDRTDDPVFPIEMRRSGDDVERQVDARRRIDRVRVHLTGMNPDKAETLILHDVLGYGLSEVSVLTGASVAAVQSRLFRARRELESAISRDQALEQKEGM